VFQSHALYYFIFLSCLIIRVELTILKIKKIKKFIGDMTRNVYHVKIEVLQKRVNMGSHFCYFFNRRPKLQLLQT